MRAYLRGSISVVALALGMGALGAYGCGGGGSDKTGDAGSGQAGSGQAGSTGGGGNAYPYDPDFTTLESKRLHVMGNKIVDSSSNAVRLLGVNRAGSEYTCTTQSKVFDGSTGPSSIAAMLTWNINTVRLPLNESCWLGLSTAPSHVAPDDYQQEIVNYVYTLHLQGLYVVLDLHWTSATGLATTQTTMADATNAPNFWSSVASRFKSDPMVIFDLFNEPILDDANHNPAGNNDAWGCWLNGCTSKEGWATAGMQQMLTAVRNTGADQIVIANGVNWSAKLDGWLSHKLTDPKNNLVAGNHMYNDNGCHDMNCWNNAPTNVAAMVPLVTGELGERDCQSAFIKTYMDWADSHGVSYLGWAWNPQDCAKFPALISNVDGTPTAFGQGLKDRLASFPPQH
jgi:endoglucanase